MKIEQLLARRTDLSTFLVHLTRAGPAETPKQRLISILRSHTIEARSPFGPAVQRLGNANQPIESQKCVCFTETPLEYVYILTSPIENRRYRFAPYGIAISKKQGRKRGVNPVWYLDITPGHSWLTSPLETLIDAAVATGNYAAQPISRLTPFIEQMGTRRTATGIGGYKKEFWWEREWRHQGDFSFVRHPIVRPIVICPSHDWADVKAALNEVVPRAIHDPAFIDPDWSLEQIIGSLAGFTLDDLGAF
ncbi:MAG TPA: abortive infection system antitoxin AbiGi family protein [Pirellulaceae bacterium]|nr:abortive infection system antitoxin AbiGi family protein [Pirellulaceae bacterium]